MRSRRLPVLLGLVACVFLAAAAAVVAAGGAGSPTDPHALPLGDGHVTSKGPRRGYVYVCGSTGAPVGGGAQANGPWIHGQTFDLTAKVAVSGHVSWPAAYLSISRVGGHLVVKSTSLPVSGYTGTFPISPSDPAYQYDRNPNAVKAQGIDWTLSVPKAAKKPTCLSGGPIGIALNGVVLFDALDALNRDAVAHEVQDSCDGHPQEAGIYHYHSIPDCLLTLLKAKPNQPSPLVGYALDGYPIYGPRGPGGRLYTDQDLDACHGHTGWVVLNGKRVYTYHYQATLEYPYTLGCFHGTPAVPKGSNHGPGDHWPPPPPVPAPPPTP